MRAQQTKLERMSLDEIHVFVDHLRMLAAEHRGEPWRFDCDGCEDTGWVYHACPGDLPCGCPHEHDAHNVVTVCPCRATNPTYQRHHRPRGRRVPDVLRDPGQEG